MAHDTHKWTCVGRALGTAAAVFSFAVLTTGCGTFGKKSTDTAQSKRIRQLERQLRKKNSIIEDLRERQMVLEKRARPGTAPATLAEEAQKTRPLTTVGSPKFSANDSVMTPEPASETMGATSSDSSSEATSASTSRELTSEQLLYSKVLETYRRKDGEGLKKALTLLQKTYPDSVFADNALYVSGMLALEMNNHAQAAEYMNRVIKEYPRSNKAVSALFVLAMVEKSRGKYGQAKRILQEVQKAYPGSPEASRVNVEMKLISLAASKRREI